MYAWSLWRSEDGVGPPGIGVNRQVISCCVYAGKQILALVLYETGLLRIMRVYRHASFTCSFFSFWNSASYIFWIKFYCFLSLLVLLKKKKKEYSQDDILVVVMGFPYVALPVLELYRPN